MVYKANLILSLQKLDEFNEPKITNITLSNVNFNLTNAQLVQVVNAFRTLISYPIVEASLVQYSAIEN